MKDIGSLFPLYDNDLGSSTVKLNKDNYIHYSLCREAIFAIAAHLDSTNKVVLIPAYTCSTVYKPFKQLNWECHYYSINRNFRIDTTSLLNCVKQFTPALIVLHPYCGMELNEKELFVLKKIKSDICCKIILDNTQCIFSTKRLSFIDYYVGSYRKWFPVPDGAYLDTAETITLPAKENEEVVLLQKTAMYLRGCYFINNNENVKSLSVHLNKVANRIMSNKITPHKMSDFSEYIYSKQDIVDNFNIRMANFLYIHYHLHTSEKISMVFRNLTEITTAPLYYPIYVKERRELQTKLAKHHIYLPVLWPVEDEEILINSDVKYIYEHILMIPIDQRYNENDMKKIVDLINE